VRKNDNDLAITIKRIERNLEEIKVAQRIAGDSWIPYRYTGSVSIPSSSIRYLVFTQDFTDIPAVVKIGQELASDLFSTGWRSVNGVHVFYFRNDGMSTWDRPYVLYSTQTGSVSVSTSLPF